DEKVNQLEDYNNITFMDQESYQIYDVYDIQNEGVVPEMIEDLEVKKSRFDGYIVNIDYDKVNGFTYGSTRLMHGSLWNELQRKAYVRGGKFKSVRRGVTVENVLMSPSEYIERCVKIFNIKGNKDISYESLIEDKKKDYDIVNAFTSHHGNIQAPVIDYKNLEQEGLHRSIYALEKGIEKIPVTVIF